MSKKSAQQGIAAPALLIGVAVVVGVVVLLVSSGALKFSGYVRVDQPQNEPAKEETPPPVPTPKDEAKITTQVYTGANFTLLYPDSWKVQESKNMVSISTKSPDGGIIIVTNPLGQLAGARLATIADANKLVAQQQFKNASFLKEEEVKLDGQDAWRYELTANNDGTDIKVIYYVLADSKNMYILMGTATLENWTKLEGSLTSSLNTFKLLE